MFIENCSTQVNSLTTLGTLGSLYHCQPSFSQQHLTFRTNCTVTMSM